MGIRQLTSLIKKHVPNGYTDVDIVSECQNYQKIFNHKPLLVIDLHGLLRLIKNIDLETKSKNEHLAKLETLCGGRYPKYQKNCEFLFALLSSHADLVFFVDGSIVVDKLDHWMKGNDEKYHKTVLITEMICRGEKLTEILKKVKDFPGSSFHLKIVEATAKKYGKLIKTTTRECDSEIAKYANENNALAVLAEDSDFLIFKGDWRYFSIDDMDISTLTSKEYNKKALWKFFGFKSFYQMAILATIAGNDLVDYDEVKRCHNRLIQEFNPQGEYLVKRFQSIADFVRYETDKRKSWEVIEIVANVIDWNNKERLRPMIKKSIAMYHTSFQLYQPSNNLEKFCISTDNNFVFDLITGKVRKFSVHYYDLRENEPNLFEAQVKIFKRQNGIIFKEINEKSEFEVIAKTKHDEPFGPFILKHEFPNFEIPPLLELLDADNHPQHDEIRWKILKWLINEEKEIEKIPQKIFADVLTLMYLCHERFLKIIDADLILLTIKMVQEGNYDLSLDIIPEVLDGKAFRVSYLFSKFHPAILRAIKLTGLKKFIKLIDFDGVIFHNLYLKYSQSDIVHLFCDDFMPYRLYT